MKFFIKLCITSIMGFVALMSAIGSDNPWPGFIIGFGVWGLFVWSIASGSEKSRKQRERERLIDEFLRNNRR